LKLNNFKVSKLLTKTLDSYDQKLASVFIPWAVQHPRYLRTFYKLRKAYKFTQQARKHELENGIKIPPFLILSITSKCNLKCTGCYASAAGNINHNRSSLNFDDWNKIIAEASELGVFFFIIAGGEPFLFPDLIDLCSNFQDRFFVILTNGTTLTDPDYKQIKRLGNIAVLVSLEGDPDCTNKRRGKGVHDKAYNTLEQLNKKGILNGISVTITRLNYKYWMENKVLEKYLNLGIRIGIFIEYIPVSTEDGHDLILTPPERAKFREKMIEYRETKPIYLIHSPGDEEYFGGCVSAGKGFAHITPAGDLTPCPVSNIATHNLTTSTLREGLASPLFSEIRDNEHLLETEGLPCALFAHPKEVDELAKQVGAYRTDLG
jgi:MoaA/NifB/PqqE/SkfB family radical SAM enzyme